MHPPDSIEGMNVTGNMFDYTAHMSSIQAKYFRGEERKKAVQRCDAASRWGDLRGCAPTDIRQKCRLNYLSMTETPPGAGRIRKRCGCASMRPVTTTFIGTLSLAAARTPMESTIADLT